ncbi:hypothetical protein [Bradyrhizobium sp. CCH5-F6]|jgi:hypothetical protein|uniref:hypothetical protein n=1 Tax=Bradyrhizobium sp. CCH5-F6 TaxID=1768753 RepID=UPI001FD927AD|nr:hypothetical protein [Bradyrhizobium sp. CCH5-F6]
MPLQFAAIHDPHEVEGNERAKREQEGKATMCVTSVLPERDRSESECCSSVNGCAVCGGKFGLIRYYSWRTALCSKKCVDRFRTRRERDHRWLFRVQAA